MVTKKVPAKKVAESAAGQRSAAAWRSRSQVEFDIEVPSGNRALVRRPGPGMFIKGGAIPDSLAPLVSEAIREKQGLPPEKLTELANDPNMITKMIGMIDSALLSIIIEPAVREDPTCVRVTPDEYSRHKAHKAAGGHVEGDELCDEPAWAEIHLDKKLGNYHVFIPGDEIPDKQRDPDFMYLSEVDLTDKIFIFNYAAGGSSDLERFRAEHKQLVDGIHASDDSPM